MGKDGKDEGHRSEARLLFKRFLAERWFGGPDFESWIRQHLELEAELRRLRDEWLAELRDPDSPTLLPDAERGTRSAASFCAGEVLGGFRLRERIGAGASGEVWMADEIALRRVVALKLLRPDIALNPHANERFRREALAEARIQHPGVVAVHSIGRIQGQAYIAQELVEGGRTVASWIAEARAGGPLGLAHFRRAAEYMAQAADALGAAHAQGIYHRDIKPHNLLLTPDERVKVADFGLAHLAGEFAISQLGDVLGTIPYMSPSQVRGQVDQLDARSDVFSLGATLYELVTLERAFPGKSLAEIAHKVQHEDPLAPRRVQPKVPSDLESIIQRALEKAATDRYPSMAEFADDLRHFLAGEPPLARSRSIRGRLRKWRRRHPTLAVGSGLALLASTVITWQAWDRGQRERLRVRERLETLEARAQLLLELGDVDQAEELVAQADALANDEPTGHLILAAGYMRLGRIPESEHEIRLALARGFRADPTQLESAIEHGAYALYLQSQRDFALYPEAERHIDRALELDPGLYTFQFTRYLLRIALRDEAGAEEALVAFQSHIPAAEPMFQVLEALRLEVDHQPAQALELLESLAAGKSEEQLKELRWHRNAGRLCVRLGELERAEPLLLRAVADAPLDCWSWDALGVVYHDRLRGGDTSPQVREVARRYSAQARECSATLLNPNYVQASIAVWELDNSPPIADPREHPSWQEAREALDRLHALGAGDTETTRQLEAGLLVHEARPLYLQRVHPEAASLLSRAVARDPDNLQASAMLAECLYWTEQPVRGMEVIQHGLECWDDPTWPGERDTHWLGMLLAWSFANAAKTHDRAAFERARTRFELELDRGVSFRREELINAAEFLATAPEGLRACDLAWRLIDDYALERAFVGSTAEAEVRKVLAAIAAACP